MLLNLLSQINSFIWGNIILWLLLLAGLFFTVQLKFIQVRFFRQSYKALIGTKNSGKHGTSSFQALCTSLAQRVGTGNMAGVATAITYGGEGAIFWMWVTALLGASTCFAECTLAQVFKIKNSDGTFYGGPAYYIHAGLRSKLWALIFSACTVVSLGFVFNAVQSNTIAQALSITCELEPIYIGIITAFLAGLIIFKGRGSITRIAQVVVPLMALGYLGMTAWVCFKHAAEIPDLIKRIITSAFSTQAAVGGILGHTIQEAFRYGVARGLFSNEAGWGSAPNAAASAKVEHPVQQGLVQMLGVYIDTLLICTATAMLILLAPQTNSGLTGIALTQQAAVVHFGAFGEIFIAIAIFLFGFTTILGNTFFGEINIKFMLKNRRAIFYYRLLVLLIVMFGAIIEVPLVWELADLMSALMALINVISLIILARIVRKLLIILVNI